MERTLTVQIEKNHRIAVVRLGGFMAQLEVYKLKSQIERLIAEGHHFVVFDLTALTFIDSAGIGVLLHTRNEAARNGGQLVLVNPRGPQVYQALSTARIINLFETFEDSAAALDHLRRKYNMPAAETQEAEATQPSSLADRVNRLETRLREVEKLLAELETRLPKPQP